MVRTYELRSLQGQDDPELERFKLEYEGDGQMMIIVILSCQNLCVPQRQVLMSFGYDVMNGSY